MSTRVYVRSLAEHDAAAAQSWYESQRVGLGAEFNHEFGQALERLEQMPFSGQRTYGDIRRLVLRRFPYLLWYVVDGSSVIVLACTHGRRSSSYTRSRLR